MESGLEEAGTLAMAGAAARAIDTPAPGAAPSAGATCRNCGAALAGPFCHGCGQKADVHRSVPHAVEEFLHGILHFDGKLWKTLPLLVFRPGRLTRDYVEGRRARYIAPVALFLLTIFSMFLLFGLLPMGGAIAPEIRLDAADRADALAGMDGDLAKVRTDIEAQKARLKANPADTAAQQELARLEAGLRIGQVARDRIASGATELPMEEVMSEAAAAMGQNRISLSLGDPALEQKVRHALSNPEMVFYKMKQKGYKLSFLLVPLSLPWMILLFAWKRDVKVYDHVIFLLYSLSFMSILFMVAAALGVAGSGSSLIVALLTLVPILHMFAQLKEAYGLGWVSAGWRTVALSAAAVLTLSAYFVLILLLGLLD